MDKDEFEDEDDLLEMSEEDDVPTLAEIQVLAVFPVQINEKNDDSQPLSPTSPSTCPPPSQGRGPTRTPTTTSWWSAATPSPEGGLGCKISRNARKTTPHIFF